MAIAPKIELTLLGRGRLGCGSSRRVTEMYGSTINLQMLSH